MLKNQDTYFKDGESGYPLCIFVHGLGMNKYVWISPEKSKVFAGRYPIDIMLRKRPEDKIISSYDKIKEKGITLGDNSGTKRTLFHDLSDMGYPCLVWSQQRPANYISFALNELKEIIEFKNDYVRNGIIVIGHSRGGLIGRKFAESTINIVKCLITISTPHQGSSIVKLAHIISRFTSSISSFFENAEKDTVSSSINRILSLYESNAMKELLSDSVFIHSLNNKSPRNLRSLSIGGTSPNLFTLYKPKIIKNKSYKDKNVYTINYNKLFSYPDTLEKILPKNLIPPEIKRGVGDGLVSEKSSKLNYSDEHMNFPLNHIEVLFNEDVRKEVLRFIKNCKR